MSNVRVSPTHLLLVRSRGRMSARSSPEGEPVLLRRLAGRQKETGNQSRVLYSIDWEARTMKEIWVEGESVRWRWLCASSLLARGEGGCDPAYRGTGARLLDGEPGLSRTTGTDRDLRA